MNVAKLKGLMAERGETQKDLAKILQCSTRTINNKINGKSEFTASELNTLSIHYSVGADIFLKSNCT